MTDVTTHAPVRVVETEDDEHEHEVLYTQQETGVSWCNCGVYFRKALCTNGVWHHVRELEEGTCPCERPQQREDEVIHEAPEAKQAHTNGRRRKQEKRCHRRPNGGGRF